MERIKEKEGEQLKIIPEEPRSQERKQSQQVLKGKEKEIRKSKNSTIQREEENNEETCLTEDDLEEESLLMIWNLPANINTEEVEHMCRSIKGACVKYIKRSKYKALAVIKTRKIEERSIPWSLPIGIHKLARVTIGEEDYDRRNMQSQFTTKLIELPGNASEVLLLRCLKKKGAKSVYIPPNKNENQRKSATIMFASAEKIKAAQTRLIRFNNYLLF